MKHPLRFVDANLRKVKIGSEALGRRLAQGARALDQVMNPPFGIHPTFRDEIVRQAIRRMVFAMIELGIGMLFRKILVPRPPARVYPFPVPLPAT